MTPMARTTPMDQRRLGRRGLLVTELGLGCAPIGNLFTPVTDEDANATVGAAWNAGARLFDTAPLYGHGLSEQRLGRALAKYDRDDYILSTKVGRLLRPSHGTTQAPTIFADAPPLVPTPAFSRDDVLRSIEESLNRLSVDRLDIVHVHDPDDHEDDALSATFPTLIQLRDEGVIKAVGCGMNQSEMLDRFVQRVDLDCVLLAGRYTLLDRSGGDDLFPRCVERGVGVIIGGVFNSGLLVDPANNHTYDYAPAHAAMIDRARTMREACERHGVTLAAAAIQFALNHPAVASVIVGARSAAEFQSDVAAACEPIATALWDELRTM